MAAARPALFALALCLAVGMGRGETYRFNNAPAPPGKVLQALYRFYVYAGSDDPEDPEGQPFIDFNSLVEVPHASLPSEHGGLKAGDTVPDRSIQLTIIPYADFWTVINSERFCSTQNTLLLETAQDANVHSVTLPVRVAADTPAGADPVAPQLGSPVRFNITRSNVYALVISNCGSIHDAKIWGRVSATNSFGHLPGDQYFKMQFYGWLSIFYFLIAFLWFLMVFFWRMQGEKLNHLHHCITFVIFLGVIEAFFSWYFMYDWNFSSKRPEMLFILNICVTVTKPVFSYVLVLITGMGWGVTRPDLDTRVIRKVQVLVFLYCFIHLLWEFLSFYRHAYDISNKMLAAVYMPALLVNLILFLWMLSALRKTSEELEGEKRVLFKRIRAMMILGLCGSLPPSAMQLLDLAGAITEDLLPSRTAFKWHYEWFVFDGTGQIIFAAVFIGVLCQWAPQNNTDRYLYSEQVNQDDEDDAIAKQGADVVEDAPPDAFAIGGRSDDEADDLEEDFAGRVGDRKSGTSVRPGPQPDLLGARAA